MVTELEGFEEFSFDTDRSDRPGGGLRTVYRRGKGVAAIGMCFTGRFARSKAKNIPVLGLRFTGDPLCKKARFDALREGFGERFKAVEVEGKGHSVLTMDFASMAEPERKRVWSALIEFLNERLR